MKKILIIGGDSKPARCFQKKFRMQCISLSRKQCDITSEGSIKQAMSSHDCDYVLNCAAITDIEACERKPLECFNVNAFGVYLLNKICLEKKKQLIHISSNYAIKPVNNYGWSKYLAEKIVSKNFLVVRTSFYSKDLYIIKNLLMHKKVNIYKNFYFNPISINKLTEEIKANLAKKGIINIFSSKKISYLKFAHLFCKTFGIDKKLINPVDFKRSDSANRPVNAFIRSDINIDIKKDLLGFRQFYQASQKP